MKNKIPVSTASIIHGVEIDESIGFISTHVVAGTNIFSDILASFSDVFGRRSNSYKTELTSIKNEALEQLIDEAIRLGGNGIVGMSIDLDEVSAQGKSMFMVTATGTAVKVSNESLSRRSENSNSSLNDITASELSGLVAKAKIISASNGGSLGFKNSEMNIILENEIFEVRDYILNFAFSFQKDSFFYDNYYSNDEKEIFLNQLKYYFSIMPYKMAAETLYCKLGQAIYDDSKLVRLIEELKLFDYENITSLLISDDLIKKKFALEIMQFDKVSYNFNDIEKHKDLIKLAEESFKPVSSIYEVKKLMSTKKVWKCLCEKEVNEEFNRCNQCCNDIFGFKSREITVKIASTTLHNKIIGLKMAFQDNQLT